MGVDRIRIVLDSDVDERAYAPLVVRHNWMNHHRMARDGDQNREWVYCTEDKANFIHFVEDHKLDVKYMLVIGPQAREIEGYIRGEVLNWPSDAIMKRMREADLSRDDRREVLFHLALDRMESGFDQQTFDFYVKALRDPDPLIRSAAVLGCSYLAWPELAEPLQVQGR